MGQQVAIGRGVVPGGEVVGAQAVLAGLVVLQAVAAQLVGQREQEVVMVVVVRAEQAGRLLDQARCALSCSGVISRYFGASATMSRCTGAPPPGSGRRA